MQSECGIILVVEGPLYIYREALVSAYSAKKMMPNLHICWATSQPSYTFDMADEVVPLAPINPFKNKIAACLRSPYKKTLFVDADTFFVKPITSIFRLLDTNDFVIGRDYAHPEEFSSGVFAFNRKGSTLLKRSLEQLTAIPDNELIRGNRDQRIITKIIEAGEPLNLGIRLGNLDARQYNARHPLLKDLTYEEREHVCLIHAHEMKSIVTTCLPNATAAYDESVAYANRQIKQLTTDKTFIEKALVSMKKNIKTNPSTVESYFALSSLYQAIHKPNDSVRVLRDARNAYRTEPGLPQLHEAILLSSRGEKSEAITAAFMAAVECSRYTHIVMQNRVKRALTLINDMLMSTATPTSNKDIANEIQRLLETDRARTDELLQLQKQWKDFMQEKLLWRRWLSRRISTGIAIMTNAIRRRLS